MQGFLFLFTRFFFYFSFSYSTVLHWWWCYYCWTKAKAVYSHHFLLFVWLCLRFVTHRRVFSLLFILFYEIYSSILLWLRSWKVFIGTLSHLCLICGLRISLFVFMVILSILGSFIIKNINFFPVFFFPLNNFHFYHHDIFIYSFNFQLYHIDIFCCRILE